MGRRFVIADGVERWKDADVEPVAAAMKGMDGETLTIALFGREEGRNKVADGLRKAVEAAGGQIAEESGVKPWELPRWVAGPRARARASSSTQAGAKALIAQVGERQQRLLRELEKLALEHGAGAQPRRRGGRGVQRLLGRAQGVDARRRARRRRRAGRDPGARRAARPGRAPPRPALPDRPPAARRARGRRGARGRPAARARSRRALRMPRCAAERLHRRRRQARRRRVPPRARADGRPRAREPRRRGEPGALDEDTQAVRARARRRPSNAEAARRRRCGAASRRATSCGRRRSCAARRA